MNLISAKCEMLLNIMAGNATMLVSGSGMGKSSIVYETFQQLAAQGEKGEWGFGLSFAATMTPIDTLGVPFKGTHTYTMFDGTEREITVTDPSVPLWMISTEGKPAFCYKHFFLFIDEYGQGESDTKRGLSEIFLSGRNGFWRLPDGSCRVAATNKGARYGVTKDFDFAIARRTVINVTRDIRVTLDWMDKPYKWGNRTWVTMPLTKTWAATHEDIVFEAEPKEQGPWCSPRTLCAFDRYLQCKQAASGGKLDPDDPNIVEMGAGTIGMPATQSYVSTLRFKMELPSYEDVIRDPLGTPVPKKADLLMLMAYELAGWTRKADLVEVLQYVNRLGINARDMELTFGAALLRREPRFILEPPVQQWTDKRAALISLINSLSQS